MYNADEEALCTEKYRERKKVAYSEVSDGQVTETSTTTDSPSSKSKDQLTGREAVEMYECKISWYNCRIGHVESFWIVGGHLSWPSNNQLSSRRGRNILARSKEEREKNATFFFLRNMFFSKLYSSNAMRKMIKSSISARLDRRGKHGSANYSYSEISSAERRE